MSQPWKIPETDPSVPIPGASDLDNEGVLQSSQALPHRAKLPHLAQESKKQKEAPGVSKAVAGPANCWVSQQIRNHTARVASSSLPPLPGTHLQGWDVAQ